MIQRVKVFSKEWVDILSRRQPVQASVWGLFNILHYHIKMFYSLGIIPSCLLPQKSLMEWMKSANALLEKKKNGLTCVPLHCSLKRLHASHQNSCKKQYIFLTRSKINNPVLFRVNPTDNLPPNIVCSFLCLCVCVLEFKKNIIFKRNIIWKALKYKERGFYSEWALN